MKPSPAIQLVVHRLVKVLGGQRVLRGASACWAAGQPHVIEGANGSGKSTLLSILAGRSEPTSGTVSLEHKGEVLDGTSLRKHAGWLGHDLGLYPDLTAFENIALHADLRGVSPLGCFEQLGAELGVLNLGNRRIRELSRGQRQRVAMVRALVGGPQLLCLDEPSTGLDSASRTALAESLLRLSANRLVLVVTHDLEFRDVLGGIRWVVFQGRVSSQAAAASQSGSDVEIG